MGRAFGTAGVRGVFNDTQTPVQVYSLAETIAFTFGRGRYGIGWDGRKASALLARTVASAVSAVGSEAALFGLVPTPVVAYGSRSRSCKAGFAVTASHNPPEFSGVKAYDGQGMELSRFDEDRVERVMVVGVRKASGQFGEIYEDQAVLEDYVTDMISRRERVSSPLRVAVDCSSGPASMVTPRVLSALGHSVVPINGQVSWRFSARPPEPTPENLADFTRMVSGMRVDIGLAHDGDADRLVLVDPDGNVLPDSVVPMMALHALGRSNGLVVISENTSMAVEEEAVRLGFDVTRGKIGKTFAVLRQEGGVLATEPSKIVDPRWGFWEDGMNASTLVAQAMSEDRALLRKLVADNRWHYKQVNLHVPVDMSKLKARAKDSFRRFKISEERTLDGLRLVFADGSWAMFRPSGTEPKTRFYCEAKDEETLNAIVQEGTRLVESSL
jgi:phosphomannomutase